MDDDNKRDNTKHRIAVFTPYVQALSFTLLFRVPQVIIDGYANMVDQERFDFYVVFTMVL